MKPARSYAVTATQLPCIPRSRVCDTCSGPAPRFRVRVNVQSMIIRCSIGGEVKDTLGVRSAGGDKKVRLGTSQQLTLATDDAVMRPDAQR